MCMTKCQHQEMQFLPVGSKVPQGNFLIFSQNGSVEYLKCRAW